MVYNSDKYTPYTLVYTFRTPRVTLTRNISQSTINGQTRTIIELQSNVTWHEVQAFFGTGVVDFYQTYGKYTETIKPPININATAAFYSTQDFEFNINNSYRSKINKHIGENYTQAVYSNYFSSSEYYGNNTAGVVPGYNNGIMIWQGYCTYPAGNHDRYRGISYYGFGQVLHYGGLIQSYITQYTGRIILFTNNFETLTIGHISAPNDLGREWLYDLPGVYYPDQGITIGGTPTLELNLTNGFSRNSFNINGYVNYTGIPKSITYVLEDRPVPALTEYYDTVSIPWSLQCLDPI